MLRGMMCRLSSFVHSRSLLLAVFSAALLVLASPWFSFSFLAWIGLIPLFYALDGKPLKERVLTGYMFGIFYFCGMLYWLVNVSVPGAIGLVFVLAVIPAFFSAYKLTGGVQDVLAVPALWVVTEFIRGNVFTGFPWCILAHSQYKVLPVIQISDVTGAYGISFLIVMANISIYMFLRGNKHKIKCAMIVLFVLLQVFLYGYKVLKQVNPSMPITVSVVQGNIPQNEKWNPANFDKTMDKYKRLTSAAAAENEKPDMIIWPETAIPGIFEDNGAVQSDVTVFVNKLGIPLLTGAVRENNDDWYNSAYFISGTGDISGFYDKMHIVPFGEYIPFEKYMKWLRGIIDKPIGEFSRGDTFTLFRIKKTRNSFVDGARIREMRLYNFGVLICFEDIFPELARGFVKNGAEFLVNITNDAWFGRSSAQYQHAAASVFRAVENRVPVIRSANTGLSCFINEKGRILSFIGQADNSIYIDGFKTETIYPNNRPSYYTRSGDIFIYVCIALCVIGFLVPHVPYFKIRGPFKN